MSVDSLYLCTYNSEGSNVDLCAEPGTTLALRGNCQAEAPSSCCLRGRCCSEARKLVNETSPLIISPLYLKMYLLWLEEFGYDIYFSFCGCLCRIMAEYGIVIYIDVPSDILAKRIVSAGIQSRPLFPPRCTEILVRAFWTILIFFQPMPSIQAGHKFKYRVWNSLIQPQLASPMTKIHTSLAEPCSAWYINCVWWQAQALLNELYNEREDAYRMARIRVPIRGKTIVRNVS